MNATKPKRKRGVFLSHSGRQRLEGARSYWEKEHNFGTRCTIEQLSELTELAPNTLNKILYYKVSVDKSTLDRCFTAFGLVLDLQDYQDRVCSEVAALPPSNCHWGEAPDVSIFYGRDRELIALEDWVLNDRCRLVTILGMGGIGKTALVTKLADRLQGQFTTVVWRSLRNAPALADLLPDLIQLCSQGREVAHPQSGSSEWISLLVELFDRQRCLLVLDNVEAILQGGNSSNAGSYRPNYADYGELFERIGTSVHQSCLLLTSREQPTNIGYLAAANSPLRVFAVPGLDGDGSDRLFDARELSDSAGSREQLRQIYTGNPLALKIVATTISELFAGDIAEFLAAETFIFDEIRELLDRQFDRLSTTERIVMYWLAIEREFIAWQDLETEIVPPIPKVQLLDTLKSLNRRCLLEQSQGKFTQQPVVIEYMTDRAIERVCQELQTWPLAKTDSEIPLWWSHPLVKTQSPEYIRASQRLQIIEPIAQTLTAQFESRDRLVAHLQGILSDLQAEPGDWGNYSGGNIFNLLRHLQVDLTDYDFSGLSMWHADLQDAKLTGVDFSGAEFHKSLFTNTFGRLYALAIDPDGQILATSEDGGDICLWQISDRQLIGKLVGHTNFAWKLLFVPDLPLLVSAGQDGRIGIWNWQTREQLHLWSVDTNPILALAFDRHRQIFASGHSNGDVRIWEVETGAKIAEWNAHNREELQALQISPDGRWLATGGRGGVVKVWDLADLFAGNEWDARSPSMQIDCAETVCSLAFSHEPQILAIGGESGRIIIWDLGTASSSCELVGHRERVFALAFYPHGHLLASGSRDTTIKIWHLPTGETIHTLVKHREWVWSLQFSPDGRMLISGSADRSIGFWDTATWQSLRVWKGYTNSMWTMMFCGKALPNERDDRLQLLTGSEDGIVRLWDLDTHQAIRTFPTGDSNVWSLDLSHDRRTLVTGNSDGVVRLWDANTGELSFELVAHQGDVWTVKFSPDGELVASGGIDSQLRLWSSATGKLVVTMPAGDSFIPDLAFSPDGRFIATGSFDSLWRLWSVETATEVGRYEGHASWIWSIDFSPDGQFVATGSSDRTVKLWEVATGNLVHTFTGFADEVGTVKFSPDSRYLAAISNHDVALIWEVSSRSLCRTTTNLVGRIICYSPDGQTIASCDNATVSLWDLSADLVTHDALTIQPPYDRMNICGAKGLTEATISALIELGAIDVRD
jgi:WD40 repeat protein